MLPRVIMFAAACTLGAAWAHSTAHSTEPGPSGTEDQDINQTLPQQIRDKLAAEGFKDVKVAPGSFVVSAKDKNGDHVVMLIGPGQMAMMKVPDDPSQAQVSGSDKDEIIQQ